MTSEGDFIFLTKTQHLDGLILVTGSGGVMFRFANIGVDSKQVELQLRFMFWKNYKLEHKLKRCKM